MSIPLEQKIYGILRKVFPPRDQIWVMDGDDDDFHVIVASRKWAGKRLSAQEKLVWPPLFKTLTPQEWGQISLLMIVTPEEAKEELRMNGFLKKWAANRISESKAR